jgi:hypothetical protein
MTHITHTYFTFHALQCDNKVHGGTGGGGGGYYGGGGGVQAAQFTTAHQVVVDLVTQV